MRTGFILEDLPESQAWLSRALATSFPGIAVDTAYTLAEARAKLAGGPRPDIALIDLGLPDGSGVEIIELIQRLYPTTLCVVASIYDDDGHVFPALRAGARGYLLKDQPVERIVEALNGIAAGEPPLSPAIARRMLAFFRPEAAAAPEAELTGRETEVLRFIAKGMTQAETARLLGISQHTVAGYVKELYRKLNVSSRAEAALRARDMGLV
ncbi:MAG: response regulator transcription factor [Thiobacillus sp.]|nr:response regulator transcription factor [Thiobacillus sp.]